MINVLRILCVFLLLNGLWSCTFDPLKSYEFIVPEVEILSFPVINDTVYAEVAVNAQGEEIDVVGIAYMLGDVASFTNNQVFFDGSNGIQLLPLPFLEPEQLYQIVAFATTDLSLGRTESISYTVPLLDPPVPPCTLDENYIALNGGHNFNSCLLYTSDAADD